MPPATQRMTRGDFTALAGTLLLSGGLSACATGSGTSEAPSPAAPAYRDAVRAIREGIERDAADSTILPAALPRLYEHGKRARHAVVLFHGFTNCPQQFDELARALRERGCNVYVPRIPRHGLRNRLTRALGGATSAEWMRCANESYELARGLGETVTALGLSLGGTMVLWLAQTQPVDLAIPVAPFLLPVPNAKFIPKAFVGDPAMRLLHTLPDMYWWWDVRVKQRSKPHYAYPGYPTHALTEMVLFGDAIAAQARTSAPRGRRCVLVLNQDDNAVDNGVNRRLLALWQRHGARYRELVLRGLGGPRHDVIDPTTFPQGRTLVYPTLESLILT
ncbi:MAG TPA: alpha/beta hydrolase [Candidatus Elarobacter sp.]|nr:alpha/beta hydrolase [Dongiaceae bacterium]HZW52550.1 alpha/beta hydrolase [Candidatus Elarobacter sp.]